MIATFADLLEALIEKGVASNNASPTRHPTLVGDMFEGLTKEILGRAILREFDLRVTDGQVSNGSGDLSRQIDCMLVVGEGAQLPHTSHYYYDVDQVLAVFEVKKTLDKGKLADAIRKFKGVTDLKLHSAPLPSIAKNWNIDRANNWMLHDAFRAITAKPFPIGDPTATLNVADIEALWSVLVDVDLPLRVVWGFEGYETECGLRNAFLDCLVDVQPPFTHIPSLVLCGDISLVKVNGMPFAVRRNLKGDREIVYSQRGLAVRNILSILWYRLTKVFRRDFLGLTDGAIFTHTPLLECQMSAPPILTQVRLEKDSDLVPHRTVEPRLLCISVEEAVAIRQLFSQDSIDFTDPSFLPRFRLACEQLQKDVAQAPGGPIVRSLDWQTETELLCHLERPGLLAREGDRLRLTTSRAHVLCGLEGFFAGENRDGRFGAGIGWGFTRETDPAEARSVLLLGACPSDSADQEFKSDDRDGALEPNFSDPGLLKLLQARTQRWSSLGLTGAPPEISISMRSPKRFDVSCRYDGQDQHTIIFDCGTSTLLFDLTHRMLCHPRLFLDIGDPTKEIPTRRALSRFHLRLDDLETEVRTESLPQPQCPIRARYARFLACLAVEFVFARNFARIMQGQLKLLRSLGIPPVLGETVSQRSYLSLSADDFDALEWGADEWGASYVFRTHLGTHQNQSKLGAESLEVYANLGQLVLSIERAMAIVTLLPESAWYPGRGPAEHGRRPLWRLIGSLETIDKVLRHRLSQGRSALPVPQNQALKDVLDARAALTWVRVDRRVVKSPAADPRHQEAETLWRERMRPMLQEVSYIAM